MTLPNLAKRRHRIALHARQVTYGEGGRPTQTYPLIATVWAAIDDENNALTKQGDRQKDASTVTFTTEHHPTYMTAKRIIMSCGTYRVTAARKSGTLHPVVQFVAQREAD